MTFAIPGRTLVGAAKTVQLVDGVRIVPAGVLRIMELQEQGYAYVRP